MGTNLGNRRVHLTAALVALAEIASIEAVSSVWASEPVGYKDQPDFWNLVVRIRTTLDPLSLLRATQAIEVRVGRTPTFPQGPRILDIDLLFYDDRVIAQPGLRVPHPRMMERGFVLRPLLELDPALVHPGTGQRLSERLETGNFELGERLFPGSELLTPT